MLFFTDYKKKNTEHTTTIEKRGHSILVKNSPNLYLVTVILITLICFHFARETLKQWRQGDLPVKLIKDLFPILIIKK